MIKGKYSRNTSISKDSGKSKFTVNGIEYFFNVTSYSQHLEIEEMANMAFESGYQKALKEIRKQISRIEKKSCFF